MHLPYPPSKVLTTYRIQYILDNTPAVLPLVRRGDPVGHPPYDMGIANIPPELLMLATDDLSLVDFLAFRSTCHRARDVLESRFHKICLKDVGELTAIQWAAIRGYAKLIEIALSNGAEIDAPLDRKSVV